MNWLNDIIGVINNYLWSYVLIVMLIGIGLWFTVRTRFVQIRCIPEMFRLMTEGAGAKPREGHISTFQAFCVSTASRVGVGNIAGIAIAVATGGPGAVFWMWVIATIGAASGFVESTLAQIYKAPRKGGGFVGGPAYYIGNVIGSSFFASVFAVLLAVTYGLIFNSVQANTISLSMQTSFGFDTQMTGLAIAGFTALVIFGGLTRIAKVVGVMVPVMAGAYILVALAVTALNITMVPEVLVTIVRCAFDFDAVLGAGFGMALMTGIKRGLFSNEAGMGAVPNAAATADATHPAKQGLVQALGVYFDTLVVCTASAMLVLLTPGWADSGKTGIELIQQTLTGQLGTWDERLHERHGPFLRLQLDHRQLLLRRNQHGLHQPSSGRALDLPRLRRDDGLPRLRRLARPRLEPRRPLHGPHGHRQSGCHRDPRQVRLHRARRLRQPEEARHPQPGIRSERHAEPPRHPLLAAPQGRGDRTVLMPA